MAGNTDGQDAQRSTQRGVAHRGVLWNLRISRKVLLVFLIAFLPVVLAGLFTVAQLDSANKRIARVSDVRLPAYVILSEISLDVSRSISAFYGFIITGNKTFRARRAGGWQKIDNSVESYEALFRETGLGLLEKDWNKIKAELKSLKEIQARQEDLFATGKLDSKSIIEHIDRDMAPLARNVMDGLRGSPAKPGEVRDGFSGVNARMLISDVRDVDGIMDKVEWTMVVMALLAGLAALAGVNLLNRTVSRPLEKMALATNAIAARDFDADVPDFGTSDEIGRMARALAVFRDGLRENARMEIDASRVRDLGNSRRKAIDDAILAFEGAADSVVLTISSTANELEASANELSHSAQNTTMEASTVAAAATQTSTTFHGLAAAGEELSGTAGEISRILAETTRASAGAVASVRATDSSAQALASAASRIGAVVGLINGLAEQTNLLALNATIEAARAGEAGQGFAVVASEVKELANQTAKATHEISEMISQIQTATGQTVSAIKDIDQSIALIGRATAEIAGSVGEQERATREIAANVQQAVEGTEEVSRSITQVSTTAHDTAAAAGQVHGAAGDLSRQAEMMRLEVRKFLDTVRAA